MRMDQEDMDVFDDAIRDAVGIIECGVHGCDFWGTPESIEDHLLSMKAGPPPSILDLDRLNPTAYHNYRAHGTAPKR